MADALLGRVAKAIGLDGRELRFVKKSTLSGALTSTTARPEI
jgi:hypothetical protein